MDWAVAESLAFKTSFLGPKKLEGSCGQVLICYMFQFRIVTGYGVVFRCCGLRIGLRMNFETLFMSESGMGSAPVRET